MRHDHDHAGEALDEGLQPGAGRRSRGRWWARRAAGRRPGSAGSRPGPAGPPGRPTAWRSAGRAPPSVEAEVVADLGAAGVEVGRADRHPVLEGGVVAAGRVGRRRRPPPRWPPRTRPSAAATPVRRASRARPVSSGRRSGSCASRATGADGGVTVTDPASGASRPASTRQQGRLADAVRADDAEAGAGADGQVDAAEDGGAGAVDDQVAGDEGDGGGGAGKARLSDGRRRGPAATVRGCAHSTAAHATGRAGRIARPF